MLNTSVFEEILTIDQILGKFIKINPKTQTNNNHKNPINRFSHQIPIWQFKITSKNMIKLQNHNQHHVNPKLLIQSWSIATNIKISNQKKLNRNILVLRREINVDGTLILIN